MVEGPGLRVHRGQPSIMRTNGGVSDSVTRRGATPCRPSGVLGTTYLRVCTTPDTSFRRGPTSQGLDKCRRHGNGDTGTGPMGRTSDLWRVGVERPLVDPCRSTGRRVPGVVRPHHGTGRLFLNVSGRTRDEHGVGTPDTPGRSTPSPLTVLLPPVVQREQGSG